MIEWTLVMMVLLASLCALVMGEHGWVALMKRVWPIVAERVIDDGFVSITQEEQ